MLVTFHSKAYADVTMFGDVAQKLLKMMGLSATVPSALMPEDIPAALQRLQEAIAAAEKEASAAVESDAEDETDDEEERSSPVALSHRAIPLIELLQASLKYDVPVMWD